MTATSVTAPGLGWRQRVGRPTRGLRLSFVVASVLLAVHAIVALTGPLWAPFPPDKLVDRAFLPPSTEHFFGTDHLGRDVFSRLVHGERIVLALSLSAATLAVVVGSMLGIVLGYLRNVIDDIGMRIIEILLSIPPVILSLLILGALGSSYPLLVATVAFFFIPRVATVIRAATLALVAEDFVTVARLRGESAFSIARRELLPNVAPAVSVEFSLRTGYAVIFIGGLSFLGFGAAPPAPEWGLMIAEGRGSITGSPWAVLAPSLALASLVVALSLFTEGLGTILGRSTARERPT
jgi:peptide/nickel transport system permease protein